MGKRRHCSRPSTDLELIILPDFTIPVDQFTTKRDFSMQDITPSCPIVPPKRTSGRCSGNTLPVYGEAKLVSFSPDSEACLSSWYNRTINECYFDQVFYTKNKIGEGSFGYVYQATCRDDDNVYAIKHFNNNHSKRSKYLEVENMEKIGHHENLLRYFMSWEEQDHVYIKMECCQMSLTQYSKMNHNIPEEQLYIILHDIIHALVYIHSKNFVHLDVKPDNILIDKGHYKLGDFGLLFNLESKGESGRLPSEGDSRYLAPEVLLGIYTPKADVFALGVTILELGTDYIMPSNGGAWRALRTSEAPENLRNQLSTTLISLIFKMMLYDYESRPAASLIQKSSIINGIMSRDIIVNRTDYSKSLDVVLPLYPTCFPINFRRSDKNCKDYPNIDPKQTSENRYMPRKLVFSPVMTGGNGDKHSHGEGYSNTPKSKVYRKLPCIKLFS